MGGINKWLPGGCLGDWTAGLRLGALSPLHFLEIHVVFVHSAFASSFRYQSGLLIFWTSVSLWIRRVIHRLLTCLYVSTCSTTYHCSEHGSDIYTTAWRTITTNFPTQTFFCRIGRKYNKKINVFAYYGSNWGRIWTQHIRCSSHTFCDFRPIVISVFSSNHP